MPVQVPSSTLLMNMGAEAILPFQFPQNGYKKPDEEKVFQCLDIVMLAQPLTEE